MRKMKKTLIIALSVLAILCLITAIGCRKSNTAQEEGNPETTVEINLQNKGGKVLSGITVNVFDSSGTNVIVSGKTNVHGKVKFSDMEPDDYKITIDESTLPKGYSLPEEVVTLSKTNMKTTVKLPSSLINEDMPSNHEYAVGDVAYNLKTTSVNKNGTEKDISIASYLSSRKAVILNFWFAGCGPCRSEFPYMNEAYGNYIDKIALIAVNSGADSKKEITDVVMGEKLNFDFVSDESVFGPYNSAFNVSAYPTTVVIDRYGVIAHIETGSMPTLSSWENLFEHYSSPDYVPNYSVKYNDTGSSGEVNMSKPDVSMPDSNDIANTITNAGNSYTTKNTFTYLPADGEDAEYSWPWIIANKDGVNCLKTSNSEKINSYAILLIDVELKKGQQVFFDYLSATEKDGDILYVQVDTVLQRTISGEDKAWNENELLYQARQDGKYQISLTYQKNSSVNVDGDAIYIKNLRIEQGTAISKHYDLLYNAVDNYTLDKSAQVYVPETDGYRNHVAYYFDDTVGLYRVALSGDENQPGANDPLLLADLYYLTPWNSLNSVWNLAYAQTGLFNPADDNYKEGYAQIIEDYAWLQQNSSSRYVPLDDTLQKVLVDVVNDIGRTTNTEDMWLEVCRYYVHYGDGGTDECYAFDNTTEALSWRMAKDCGVMTEDEMTVHVNVYSLHLPRGNYYSFTTTKAGAYLIRSIVPNYSDYDKNAIDPLGFICDEYGNILAENDNYVIEAQGEDEEGNPLYDNNFYLFVYLEANTTYHVAGCFYDQYAMGQYDVKIEYLGETCSYFTACAIDPAYTFDENDPNYTPFILPKMGKDMFFIGDDGNYYAQEFNGLQGSLLYIRVIGPTFFNSYSEYTLEQMIENDMIGTTTADKIYMRQVLLEARTAYDKGDELYGYAVATERLVSILNKMANGSDTEEDSTYSQTAWLLTAYYYRNLNELTLAQAQDKYK